MRRLVMSWLCLFSGSLWAQFPPLEISLDQVNAAPSAWVEISVRAGSNWLNITELRGTLGFDESIIDQPVVVFWGLTDPSQALFQDAGHAITFEWASLITVGPNLNLGDVVFTLRFQAKCRPEAMTALNLLSTPEPLFWANGFGWTGNNFAIIPGSVTVETSSELVFCAGFEP
ncbi:hypothetical protein [Marinicella meishanensis]|uniref:hypothetical protein n=1 Tax=Marinicella meishanensis TaxID=2873263 RepID=UPI001CBF7A75|nr:hypothetical protein [Marinicella sp. NBU2979]